MSVDEGVGVGGWCGGGGCCGLVVGVNVGCGVGEHMCACRHGHPLAGPNKENVCSMLDANSVRQPEESLFISEAEALPDRCRPPGGRGDGPRGL